ncbi:MAG TPA: sodium:proton antiporter NhaD [Bacteroidia bacterium]|nr:sodium:proton antiporter NhaD [Bacteroidia bacterium]
MLLASVFILGYLAIAFEQTLKVNKSASALLTGVVCWMIVIAGTNAGLIDSKLGVQLSGISEILFFLLGAMAIVELIDAHDGFTLITEKLRTKSKRKLLFLVSLITFLLSSVLNNLTTALVMMSLVRKLVKDPTDRMYYGGMIIIAANAGGVWSPVGDVTTTMLWIGGQISSLNIILKLFVPALVSLFLPYLWLRRKMSGNIEPPENEKTYSRPTTRFEQNLVLFTGAAVLLLVPVFKSVTLLPPYMGILFGLGILWSLTEIIHKQKNDEVKSSLSVAGALQRIDTQSILFFFGILLAIGALDAKGTLVSLAEHLHSSIGNLNLITLSIGLSSAIVDNVPLVAAAQGMYPLAEFPRDFYFWEFLAYCAGTGGSILIIGSAAGVAVMGTEHISFGWYLRKISVPAIIGYFGGALAYIAIVEILH